MVRAVRQGMSMRKVARRHHMSLNTVQYWVKRAESRRLDRVDWEDRSHRPRRTTRTAPQVEQRVLEARAYLRDESVLGEYGADAILLELERRGVMPLPSRTTISRILRRRGALEGRRRLRRPAPPKGWYLPPVARAEAELDSFDFIEDLVLRDGPRFHVLTGISLHGGLPAAFPMRHRTARAAVQALRRHWRRHGLPGYAQFDNDTIFQGAHQFRDTVGRVTRLCLALGVVPVFAPPGEHGPQNAVEGYNGRWEAKVWERREWSCLPELRGRSNRYLTALRKHRAKRLERAPARRPCPDGSGLDVNVPFRGMIIYLRRLDEDGRAFLLGHTFPVARRWAGRLVRAEVDLDAHCIRFYGLRRREPTSQPRIRTVRHRVGQRPFQG
jgi:hypothetical protein